ncbi:MAG: LacI family DNA-binding transcriptional regulator [Paracoccaceae bacterium]
MALLHKQASLPPARASIRDVARKAGVSAACVSNVLNRRRSQEDLIGRAVLAAVADLGYRANTIAANLRRTNSRFVGVVLPDFENPFFGALLSALERSAEAAGYRLATATSREDPAIQAREVEELLGWRVAGILVVPAYGSLPGAFAEAGVPMVVVDRVSSGPGDTPATDEVSVDNEAAARAVAERLIALGHRHILVACSDPQMLNMAERLRGVEAAAAASGLPVQIELLNCGWTVESADAAFTRRGAAESMPRAIFALQNLASLAAYGAARRLGLTPGIDLALASFDDSAWMAHMHPAVTAVAQPVEAIAEAAFAMLVARIEGADAAPQALRVPCQLIERATLIAPNQNRSGDVLPPRAKETEPQNAPLDTGS